MLEAGLTQEIEGFSGITISSDEAQCLDMHLSDALSITFPASWSDYKQAMGDRVATIVSTLSATGEVTPDPLPGEAMKACLTAEHGDALFALNFVPPTKWSDHNETQRSCLVDRTRPFQESLPAAGVDQDEIREACGIS